MVGKTNQKWDVVKQVINSCVRKYDNVVYLPDAECSYPPKEGPSPPVGGGSIPSNKETKIDSQSMRACSFKKMGARLDKPPELPLEFTGLLL